MRWVMDNLLMDRATETPTGQPTLAEAAREAGHEVYLTGRVNGVIPDLKDIPFDDGVPVITYGSHQFVTAMEREYGSLWTPGTYHRIKNLSYSAFSAHIGDLLLNDDYVILPYAEVKRRQWNDAIFIRPDAVTKAFAGFLIPKTELAREFSALDQISNPDPEMLVVVAPPKNIRAEFRFVIVDRQVVTGSEYRWDGKMDVRIDVHPDCEAMAWQVAQRPWQPDIAYTCDVALVEIDGVIVPRVIELNTMSCSGLYACDTRKIVAALEKAAWAEFGGEV